MHTMPYSMVDATAWEAETPYLVGVASSSLCMFWPVHIIVTSLFINALFIHISGLFPLAAGADREAQALFEAGRDRNSALYKAAVRIQANFRGYVVRKAYKLYKIGGVVSEILYSPAAFGLDMSTRNMPKPRGRISALMACVGNTLWLSSGIVEIGDKEITLDDMWCLDLVKLDGWTMVRGNSVGEELFQAGSDSSSYETDSGGEAE